MPLDQNNIRSTEVDEILGKTPNKIVRSGISVILIIVIVLLAGSWFFKYPDKINAPIEIIASNPPADVIARHSGKIDSIFIKNNHHVEAGQVLAVIENPANYFHVRELKFWLKLIEDIIWKKDMISDKIAVIHKDYELGELQTGYSMLYASLISFNNYLELNYSQQKSRSIQNQIIHYNKLYEATSEQKKTVAADLSLSENDFNRHQVLFDSLLIPQAELDRVYSSFLNKKFALENIENSLMNIEIQISQLEATLLELELQHQQELLRLSTNLKETWLNLHAQIEIWEQRFVLIAPIAGVCNFTNFWDKNHNISLNDKFTTIIPADNEMIIGKLMLPVSGAGKVRKGQTVNVKLDNYPYMEYGVLSGFVENISVVPDESFYYAEVAFTNGLETSYGTEIAIKPNMMGAAEVITDDVRLFYRLLLPVKSVFTERF